MREDGGARVSRDESGQATDVTIRPAQPYDWPAVAALLETNTLPLDGAEEQVERFLLAEGGDGALLGCAALERYGESGGRVSGLLRSVAVAAGARRRGVGARLVERLLAQGRAEGLADVTLLTTTAARYFPRFGFRPIPREQAPEAVRASLEFRVACPDSAVVMLLPIEQGG